METTFLEEWNLRFGSKPPEWVFHLPSDEPEHPQHMIEDIDREIRMRQTNIEQLTFEIQREEFLLDWLCQRKAKLQDKDHPWATLKGPTTERDNSQEIQVNGGCSSPNDTHVLSEDNFDKYPVEQTEQGELTISLGSSEGFEKETSPSGEESSQKISPLASQGSPSLEAESKGSLRSLTDSSDYYTAGSQISSRRETIDTNVLEEDNSTTSGNSTYHTFLRERISHKVINGDAQIAKAVRRHLIEQGPHWSCQFLDLQGKDDDPSLSESLSPLLIKRSVSDPVTSLSRSKLPSVTFQSDQPQIPSSCSPCTLFSGPLSSEKEAGSSDALKSLEPIDQNFEQCEQRDDQTEIPSKDSNPLAMLVEDDTKGPAFNEGGSFPIVGKRGSNGIILDSLDSNKILAMEDGEECDPLLNLMASHAQKTRTPRSSLDHVRERIRGVRLSNGDLEVYCSGSPKNRFSMGDKENNVSDPSSEGEPALIKKRASTELSPLAPWYKFDRRSMNIEDDECTTPRGEIAMSLTPDNSSDATNNASESSGVLSDELLDDPEHTITRDRAFLISQRPKIERHEMLTLDNAGDQNRKFSMESFDKNSDPTRARVLDFKQSTPNIKPSTIGFLRLDSLSEELHKALTQIRTTPEMSMATLLDLDENAEMNYQLQEACSEPSLDDLELFESGEVDEATISAYTLRNEIFGSRSNSTTSIPSLFMGPESVSSTCSSTPDIPNSPNHPSVNLRPSSGGKRRERKRMGNAALESIATVGSDDGSDFSPAHMGRGSISPLADESSDVLSPSSRPHGMIFGSNEPPPLLTQQSSIDHSSLKFHVVRRSTVVVHGEQLVIRKLVVAGIVSAEKTFIDCLVAMKEYYKKLLLARTTTSQPILSERDINTIFYRVEDLHVLHTSLHDQLEPSLVNWSVNTCVGDFFVCMCRNLQLYKDYVEMYKKSIACLNKHKQENPQFISFMEDVHATVSTHFKDIPRVNELLRRPVERLQSYSLVLNDLCQHTPDDHPDYRILRESLQVMTAFIASTHDPQSFKHLSGGFNRELVKYGLVVELSDGTRKLRRLFLFHDVLVCSKQKPSRGGVKFEAKWYLPLNEISFKPPEDSSDPHRPVPVTSDVELSVMKNKIAEYKALMNKDGGQRERTPSISSEKEDKSSFKRNIKGPINLIKGKNAEKYRKRLEEQQVAYWMASPSLPLRVYGRTGKQYVFLLHNEEERENWVSAIKKRQPKVGQGVYLSQYELQDLLNQQTVKDIRKVEEMIIPTIDDEYLNGILRVRVTTGLDIKAKSGGLYCCLELDEYGKLDRKARTLPSSSDNATLTSTWDQDFEIELAGAHILKLLICSKSLLKEEIHAHGKIRLPIKELKQSKRQKLEVKLFPQGSVDLILEYYSNVAAMLRKPSLLSSGVFGVPIEVVSKRERHDIPLIVQTCIDEIEKRGLSEVGIYRVAGVLRDVQELRNAFDTDYLKAQMIAYDADIHAVAGLLKRYFRELPDPLFTNELYTSFVQGLGLSDPDAKAQCLLTLLHSLPPVNFKTAVFLFRHLRRIADNLSENKMSLNNLSTVFGPNLLSPGGDALNMDVVSPVSVVLFFLNCPEEYFDESLFGNSPQSTSSTSSSNKSKGTVGGGGFTPGEGEVRRDTNNSLIPVKRPSMDEQDFAISSSPNRLFRRSKRGSNKLTTAIKNALVSGKESAI